MHSDDFQSPAPPFQFSLWDMMVWVTFLCCYAAIGRRVGLVGSFLLLPAIMIPAVLTHPDNSREVKIVFIVAAAFLALKFAFFA